MTLSNREVKEAALIGLRHKRSAIEEQIQQLEAELDGRSGRKGSAASSAPTQKRVLSPTGRRRIAAAQRKRWAAVRQAKRDQSEQD